METAHATTAAGLDPLSLVLWDRAQRLHPWELVVDVGANPVTTLDELVGSTARACCIKVGAEGHGPDVLAGAAGILGGTTPYALMLDADHLTSSFLAELAAERATYLMDRQTHRLIRIPGGNVRLATRMRNSAWLYGQDCLVLSDGLDVTG